MEKCFSKVIICKSLITNKINHVPCIRVIIYSLVTSIEHPIAKKNLENLKMIVSCCIVLLDLLMILKSFDHSNLKGCYCSRGQLY